MGLSLGGGGDGFEPWLRWEASISLWSKSTEDEGDKKYVTLEPILIDLASIQTGWFFIAKDETPERRMDQSITQPAPKPTDGREWKRGFAVHVFGKCLDGVREFATSASGANLGIESLYEEYEKQAPGNPGLIPVCQFIGAQPRKLGKGNTTIPMFQIIKWVARPADFTVEQPAQETATAAPVPPTPAATPAQVAPVVPQPPQAVATPTVPATVAKPDSTIPEF